MMVQMRAMNAEKMAAQAKERSENRKMFLLEVIVMTPIVLIIVVAFLIPSILYALPPPDSSSLDSNSSEVSIIIYYIAILVINACFNSSESIEQQLNLCYTMQWSYLATLINTLITRITDQVSNSIQSHFSMLTGWDTHLLSEHSERSHTWVMKIDIYLSWGVLKKIKAKLIKFQVAWPFPVT